MEISKPNKLQKPKDISNLLSEVASFASSIGLSSSLPSSGFNDSDFRISGPLKPHKPSTANREHGKTKPNNNNHNHKNENKPKSRVFPMSKKKTNNSRVSPSETKPLPKLPLMKAASLAVWYSDAAELEGKVIGDKKLEVVNVKEWEDVVREKRVVGERLLAQYAQDYELSSRRQRGDMKMLYAVQKSGTTQDKTSAYSVLVAENPIANLKSLDSLLDMVASKGGKRYAFMGFDTLKELFIYCLLPDRKLKELKQRPLNNLPESKDGYSLLLFWYWEDCLKSRYKSFISALEEASRDVLHSLKDKALKVMYALLTNKSEEGRRLLSALVNKLGDPGNKTASTANFHLLKLLPIHPNMKCIFLARYVCPPVGN